MSRIAGVEGGGGGGGGGGLRKSLRRVERPGEKTLDCTVDSLSMQILLSLFSYVVFHCS